MIIKRGDIYYIGRCETTMETGSEMYAGRPAIVVSNEKNNTNSDVIDVVYLTTRPKSYLPTHVTIRSTDRESTALCEQISSISVKRIRELCGRCTDNEMAAIDKALAISIGIEATNRQPQIEYDTQQSSDENVRILYERNFYKSMYEHARKMYIDLCVERNENEAHN